MDVTQLIFQALQTIERIRHHPLPAWRSSDHNGCRRCCNHWGRPVKSLIFSNICEILSVITKISVRKFFFTIWDDVIMNKVRKERKRKLVGALILRNHSHNNITIVENDFIDHYMVSANGEYVKSLSSSSPLSEYPERLPDIRRWQTFWRIPKAISCAHSNTGKKKRILSLEYDETNELAGICIGKAPTHQTPVKAFPYTFRTVCFRS